MDLHKHLRFLLFLAYTALILAALAWVLPGCSPFCWRWRCLSA